MNTVDYINDFRANAPEVKNYRNNLTAIQKIKIWIHKHPTAVKTIQIANIIFGLASIVAAPFSWTVLGVGAIAIAATGGLIAIINALALKFLEIKIPPHHDMKHHVFKTGEYGAGKLYYKGDIPILEVLSDDPFKAGEAQGFRHGPYINKLHSRLQFLLKLEESPMLRSFLKF